MIVVRLDIHVLKYIGLDHVMWHSVNSDMVDWTLYWICDTHSSIFYWTLYWISNTHSSIFHWHSFVLFKTWHSSSHLTVKKHVRTLSYSLSKVVQSEKRLYTYIGNSVPNRIGWFSSVSTTIVITEKLHNRKTWNKCGYRPLTTIVLPNYKHHENKFWYKTSFALRCWNLSILSKQSVITIFH